jgi:hypothetical protein
VKYVHWAKRQLENYALIVILVFLERQVFVSLVHLDITRIQQVREHVLNVVLLNIRQLAVSIRPHANCVAMSIPLWKMVYVRTAHTAKFMAEPPI